MKIKIFFIFIIIFPNIKSIDLPYNKSVYNIMINNRYLNFNKGKFQISTSKRFEEKSNFRIELSENSLYYIEHVKSGLILASDSSSLKLINKLAINNTYNIQWHINKEEDNKYIIQSKDNCFLRFNNNNLKCENIKMDEASKFTLIKLCDEVINSKEDIKLIEKEPIDVVIKYIDLGDPKLNRDGIPQIKKDEDNEELRYCLRSILKNIPWIRKIIIILPNENVRFLKDYDYIKEKIVYINDKDFLGFDSANSNSFQFNLWRLKEYNVSENILLMDDDYFIGNPLKKSDFFYVKDGEVAPAIVSTNYAELSKNIINARYNSLKKKALNAKGKQNSAVFQYSLINTFKFVLKLLDKNSLLIPLFTHNAIPFNLDKIKEIYNLTYKSQFKEPTLYSIFRDLEALQFQTFYVVYNFNKNRNIKVNFISNAYYDHTKALIHSYKESLFVLNTGGDDYPPITFKKARIAMERKFPEPTPYEIYNISFFPNFAFDTISELDNELREYTKKKSDEKKDENTKDKEIKNLEENAKKKQKKIKILEEENRKLLHVKDNLLKLGQKLEKCDKKLLYFNTLEKYSNENLHDTAQKIIDDNIKFQKNINDLKISNKNKNTIIFFLAIILAIFICSKIKDIRFKKSMDKIKLISSENDLNEMIDTKNGQREYYYLMNPK